MQALQSFGRFAGTMSRGAGVLGYITQDIGTEVMITAAQCASLGGALPPVGTRLTFDVVLDPTMGMLRAENVQLELAAVPQALPQAVPQALPQAMPQALSGLGGLVAQPQQQLAQQLMPSLDILSALTMNRTAGLASTVAAQPVAPAAHVYRNSAARRSGIFAQAKDAFGFIKQDSGEADMFVIPKACIAFGNCFPPIGTRVLYEVGVSERTGRPTAENVRPGSTGTMAQVKNNFGFIKQDSGEPDMFVIPQACPYFGTVFPPIGMRVTYEVATSDRTGRPRAEDVQPMFKEQAAAQLALPGAGGLPALMAGQQPAGLTPELVALLANGTAPSGGVEKPVGATAAEPNGEQCTALVPFETEPDDDDEPDAKRPRLDDST